MLGRAIVRDLYEGARAGRELSRMGTIMGLVPALAPIFGGVLHEYFGWRSTFAATVLFGLCLARRRSAAARDAPRTVSGNAFVRDDPARLRNAPARTRPIGSTWPSPRSSMAGLFAFISGSSFVLQGVYGLARAALRALLRLRRAAASSLGTTLAQRLVGRRGLDGTIALGVVALAAGGAIMLVLVLLGVPTSFAVTAPMAIYTLGVGLTMPQTRWHRR